MSKAKRFLPETRIKKALKSARDAAEQLSLAAEETGNDVHQAAGLLLLALSNAVEHGPTYKTSGRAEEFDYANALNGHMTQRAIKALQTTFNYIASDNHGIPDEDLYELSADCYLELHGNDKEACEWFWKLEDKEQTKIMKKAFPSYKGN